MPNLKVPGHLHNIWSRNIFPVSMEGCVLYLPFWQEDMQGSTILSYDHSLTSCAVTDATYGITGRDFNGTSAQIAFATFDKANWTVESWFKADTITTSAASPWGNGILLSFDGAVTNSLNIMLMSSDEVGWNIQRTGNTTRRQRTTDSPFSTGVWNHLALTKAGDADVIVYVNTVVNATRTNQTNDSGTPGSEQFIGGYETNAGVDDYWFDGVIGEVRVYSRALTPVEIQNNYQVTKWRYI